jgi:hypothetical protein
LPVKFLRPAAALLEGETAWAQDFEAAMRRTEGSVCIDGIELLSDKLLDLVIQYVDARRRPQLIFVSGPVSGLTGRAAALAGTASAREELMSLSARRAEIPELAGSMLQAAAASGSVHLTPGAVQALTAHEWPGNLRELKAVIGHAAARRTCGGIALSDLPQQYRSTVPAGPMAALDRAERDVIVPAAIRCRRPASLASPAPRSTRGSASCGLPPGDQRRVNGPGPAAPGPSRN